MRRLDLAGTIILLAVAMTSLLFAFSIALISMEPYVSKDEIVKCVPMTFDEELGVYQIEEYENMKKVIKLFEENGFHFDEDGNLKETIVA